MNIYRIIGGEKMEENLEEKKIFNIQIGVAIGGIILGTLLHFLYHWTGENGFIAAFSATNESVWEHLKLVFFPMLVLGIVEYFFVKDKVNNYIEAKVIGIFATISFVVVVFYTYTGMLGTNFFLFDILIFIASILLGEWIAYQFFWRPEETTTLSKVLSFVILGFLLFSFIFATYFPPEVNFFKDPTTGEYGRQ